MTIEPGTIVRNRYRVGDPLVEAPTTTIYAGESSANGHPVVFQTIDVFADSPNDLRHLAEELLTHLKQGTRAIEQATGGRRQPPLCCGQTNDGRIYLVHPLDPDSASDLANTLTVRLSQVLNASDPLPDNLEQMLAPVLEQDHDSGDVENDESTREVKADNLDSKISRVESDVSTTPEIDIGTLDIQDEIPTVRTAGESDTGPWADTLDESNRMPGVTPEVDGGDPGPTVDATDEIPSIDPGDPAQSNDERNPTVGADDSFVTVEPEETSESSDDARSDQNATARDLPSISDEDVGGRTENPTRPMKEVDLEDADSSDEPESDSDLAKIPIEEGPLNLSDDDSVPDSEKATVPAGHQAFDPSDVPSTDPEAKTTPIEDGPVDSSDPESTSGSEKATLPAGPRSLDSPDISAAANSEETSTPPEDESVDTSNDDSDDDPSVKLGPRYADEASEAATTDEADPDPTTADAESESGTPIAAILGTLVVLAAVAAFAAWFFLRPA